LIANKPCGFCAEKVSRKDFHRLGIMPARGLLIRLFVFMMLGSIRSPAEHQTMAHKKGQGSTQNGRDSNAQFRGIKLFGGQLAQAGSVLVSQCGTKWRAGYLVHQGRDYTLTALVEGKVRFRGRSVDIIPADPTTPRMAIDR
jgi:large subunit ribosomal protein L27